MNAIETTATPSKKIVRSSKTSLLKDQRGLSTVEYIIVLCLIAVVGFAIWKKFGETIKTKTSGADTQMQELPVTSSAE